MMSLSLLPREGEKVVAKRPDEGATLKQWRGLNAASYSATLPLTQIRFANLTSPPRGVEVGAV
jgi:hypothetical protein